MCSETPSFRHPSPAVLPEAVGNGHGGEKALAYSELIPVPVEAVKELKAENEALKQRLDALERAR